MPSAPAHSPLNTPRSAVVVGGGLAGIAAGVRLAERGVAVTLVETRQRLGGRATSFSDPTHGKTLDNCQHVLLACCTNLIDLYERLGVAGKIDWHRTLHFADGQGHLDTLEADDTPAPLHMTASLLRFRGLTWAEKIAISRGMLAMMRLGVEGREKLHDRTFADWLAEHGQPAGAVEKFWGTVAISAINELPERMAAAYAIQVFQEGFLANERSYIMGLSAVPLVELYDAAERVIAASGGGRVMLSTSAERFVFDGERVTALRFADGTELSADVFISAVPFDRLAKLATPAMLERDDRLRPLDRMGVSPIIGIHLFMDRPDGKPVMELPHLIFTQSPLQWVFNKGADAEIGGQHLHGVISAAHALVDQPADRIIELAFTEMKKVLPAARNARLIHGRVVKEKRATFSAGPGFEALRPDAHGAIGNLYLAGDWCRTGWPATMEGAARSGYLAAAAALDQAAPLVADLPHATLYSLIAR